MSDRKYRPTHLAVSETNALAQTRTTVWDFPCGEPDTETDLNGLASVFLHDVFCRPIRVERPARGAFEALFYAGLTSSFTACRSAAA